MAPGSAGHHLLRALVAIAAAGNLAFGALGLTIIVRARDLGASPASVGVLLGLFGAVYTVGALMGPIFQTTSAAYRYALTPDRLQGRVQGVSRMIGWCTVPLGALLGGLSVQTLGAVPTLAALATCLAIVATASTTSQQIRRAPRPERPPT